MTFEHSCVIKLYLQVRPNPQIRFAELVPASCVFYVTRQVCLKISHVCGKTTKYSASDIQLGNADALFFSVFLTRLCDILYYLHVRANPPIRFAEWSGDKNL